MDAEPPPADERSSSDQIYDRDDRSSTVNSLFDEVFVAGA